MEFDIIELTEMLEINDQELEKLKYLIISSFGDGAKMKAILRQHRLCQEETHCYACDDEGDCFMLHGIVRLDFGETENAIKEIETANLYLRRKDETWNSICGLVLLGMAYEMCQKDYLAIHEYKKAHLILANNYLPLHMDDYIEKARLLEIKLQHKISSFRQ